MNVIAEIINMADWNVKGKLLYSELPLLCFSYKVVVKHQGRIWILMCQFFYSSCTVASKNEFFTFMFELKWNWEMITYVFGL